jgi:restriction system protein
MAKRKSIEGIKFLRFFGPLLDALRKLGGSGTPDEVVEQIAADLNLSDEVQNELLPSGGPRYRNQVAWARFYLVREGLLDSSKRGVWSLTERGRATHPTIDQAGEIFSKWVKIFDEQRRAKAAADEPIEEQVAEGSGTPSKDYRTEALDILLALPASGFERLAQRLLREAGFTQVVVTGQSGDGGIDGYGTLQINPLVSFHWSHSRFCFSASGIRSRSPHHTFETFAARWPDAPTRALSSLQVRSPPRRDAKPREMGCLPSNSSTARSCSICLRIWSSGYGQ